MLCCVYVPPEIIIGDKNPGSHSKIFFSCCFTEMKAADVITKTTAPTNSSGDQEDGSKDAAGKETAASSCVHSAVKSQFALYLYYAMCDLRWRDGYSRV